MTVTAKALVVTAQFEPNEKQQLKALTFILQRSLRRTSVEGLSMSAEMYCPRRDNEDSIHTKRRGHGTTTEICQNDNRNALPASNELE
jgi:hypothetical protein